MSRLLLFTEKVSTMKAYLGIFLCLFLFAVLAAQPDQSDLSSQFLLLDVVNEWTGTTMYREADGKLGKQPEQWGAPVDFQYGTLYIRLEVIEKPSELPITSMICLWQKGNECCTRFRSEFQLIEFSKEGIYYNSYPAPGKGDDEKGSIAWNRPSGDHTGDYYFKPSGHCDMVLVQWWTKIKSVVDGKTKESMKILRHNPENGVHAVWDYGEKVKEHIPIKYRLEIYAVEKGAEFVRPAHWKN